jgi:hypothetical protein
LGHIAGGVDDLVERLAGEPATCSFTDRPDGVLIGSCDPSVERIWNCQSLVSVFS